MKLFRVWPLVTIFVLFFSACDEGLGPLNDGDIVEIEIEKLGRAKFFTKAYGPRKEEKWAPPIPQPGQRTGPGMSRV